MTTQFDNQDSSRLSDQLAYDPNNLLDTLIDKLHLKNDAALSRALEVAPPVISKIRHRRLPVGASLLSDIQATYQSTHQAGKTPVDK